MTVSVLMPIFRKEITPVSHCIAAWSLSDVCLSCDRVHAHTHACLLRMTAPVHSSHLVYCSHASLCSCSSGRCRK
jgi:hypothetical protein